MLKEARKAYLSIWRANNRDKTRAAQQRYYEQNKEVCNARVKTCRAAKPDYYTQKTLDWANENRERHLENRRQYYARNSAKDIAKVRRRTGKIKHGEMLMNQAEIAEVQGMYDFCKVFKQYEVDHVVPLNGDRVSGLHVLANLQVLSRKENRSKRNKFTIE